MRQGAKWLAVLALGGVVMALLICGPVAPPASAQHAPPGAVDVVTGRDGAAGGGKPCLRARRMRDADLRRNADVIARAGHCVSQIRVGQGGTLWRFSVIRSRVNPNGPAFVVLHDDEDAAFDAGLGALARFGGALLAVEASETRSHDGRDPNHTFAATDAQARGCAALSGRAAPHFTAAVMDFVAPGRPVIALHSNHDGHLADGVGRGTISAGLSHGARHGFATPTPRSALSDADNAILIPSRIAYRDNRAAQAAVRHFAALGINVIFERVRASDCSLSHYVTLNHPGRPYYNIEAEHGAVADQGMMIDALMAWTGFARLD